MPESSHTRPVAGRYAARGGPAWFQGRYAANELTDHVCKKSQLLQPGDRREFCCGSSRFPPHVRNDSRLDNAPSRSCPRCSTLETSLSILETSLRHGGIGSSWLRPSVKSRAQGLPSQVSTAAHEHLRHLRHARTPPAPLRHCTFASYTRQACRSSLSSACLAGLDCARSPRTLVRLFRTMQQRRQRRRGGQPRCSNPKPAPEAEAGSDATAAAALRPRPRRPGR